MTDIVLRLRAKAEEVAHQVRGQDIGDWNEIALMREAADEIERLKAKGPAPAAEPQLPPPQGREQGDFSVSEGHNKPCYYCGEPCNSLAGNPGKWPIALCHRDDPGRVKWHHTECVTSRLIENQPQGRESVIEDIDAIIDARLAHLDRIRQREIVGEGQYTKWWWRMEEAKWLRNTVRTLKDHSRRVSTRGLKLEEE